MYMQAGIGDAGASLTKRSLRAFNARSGAPIEDIDFHNATMRQRGRMRHTASPIAAAAVNTNRTKIVGPGLKNEVGALTRNFCLDFRRKVQGSGASVPRQSSGHGV